MLAYPDFEQNFLLETDASGAGLGAVLAQKLDGIIRPVAFASRTLQPHEKNYGVTELEGLGVVWVVKHFRPYLYGHQCDVFTDHVALKSLLSTPQPSGKLARWGMAIQELDLNIHYRPGKKNSNADALSRYPLLDTDPESLDSQPLAVVAATSPSWVPANGEEDTLPTLQRKDAQLAAVVDYLEKGILPSDDKKARELVLSKSQYTIIEGVLYRIEGDKTLRMIPPTSQRDKLFHQAHDGKFGAHLRDAKIHGELSRHYWWPGMRSDIIRWCKGCLTCASRRVGRATKPPLTPIPVVGPFDRVGVDVIQLPMSYDGNQYRVVFVDYLTKWPEVFAVPGQTSLWIAQLLVDHIISRHGVPAELLSDRGKAFLSTLMDEIYKLMGIQKVSMTAYHPQTDGLVERFNRTLTDMLTKTVDKSGRDWDRHLPHVLFAYRVSPKESTRESPFFLLYGRDPQIPTEAALSHPKTRYQVDLDDYKKDLVGSLSQAWELARTQVKKAQQKQKKYYDRQVKGPRFQEGDRVFVYMPAATKWKAHKFAHPFHGPYRILELSTNDTKVVPVDKPRDTPLLVALERVHHCPDELPPDEFWPSPRRRRNSPEEVEEKSGDSSEKLEQPTQSWKRRLRSRPSEDVGAKGGDM